MSFLGVSMRLFLDKTNIWISRLSKADFPLQVGGHHPHWRSKEERKSRKGVVSLSLPVWAGTLVFSGLQTGTCTASSVSKKVARLCHLLSLHNHASPFLTIDRWMKKSISLPASPMGSVSLQNPNTCIFWKSTIYGLHIFDLYPNNPASPHCCRPIS